ncbi:hypothetical protein B0H11DRAFT_2343836 [Mycena galericulata]|nr:hypothetical protein B0H11DRAFT_2343836 [Mycena galericulata]
MVRVTIPSIPTAASLEYPPGFTVHNKPIQRSKLNHCVRLTKYLDLTAASVSSGTTTPSSSSSKFPSSSSVRQSTSTSSSSSASFPLSTSISPSSPSQAPLRPSTSAKITTASHQTVIIAATTASIAALILLLGLGFFIYCRRRSRRNQLDLITSQRRSILPENSTLADYSDKDWKDTVRSTTGSGWPSESQPTSPVHRTFSNPLPVDGLQLRQSAQPSSPSARAPHYTVRSRASMTDVYGFGQDVAWQEAHYEDPLPIGSPARSADIRIIPPTPLSDISHHDTTTASATPLLRSPSAASTVSSQYSIASMPGRLPDIAVPVGSNDINVPPTPAPAVIHDALATDDRDWIDCTRSSVAPPHR